MRDPKKATTKHLLAPNVTIIENPPKRQLRQLYRTSTIYLSTQPTEAFGLSIIEAMSGGCIPLVPRDGGPWHDILDEKPGEAGYSFETPSEAGKHIDNILNNENLARKLSQAAKQRAKKFQGDHFEKTLPHILAEIYSLKTKNV
jgi:glycosyltransferase involved in cell wall biosynthesis